MKSKFVCVTPKSSKAKNRFCNIMENFHSCKVEQEKDNLLKVEPVVSTRKFCNDANFYEQQFTKQLQLADRIEIVRNKLQLFKDNQMIIEMTQALN